MTEYSYSDLVKMQDQAIRRVREMQERARLTVREHPIPELQNENATAQNEKEKEASKIETPKTVQQTEDTKLSEKLEKRKDLACTKETARSDKKEDACRKALDKDKAILLPLLMLLSREGADNALIIALLYILS